MIEKRGASAGVHMVRAANERAEREERLMRDAEAKMAADDVHKVARERAAREKMAAEVAASRAAQIALKARMKAEADAEAEQFVQEVRCVTTQLSHFAGCSALAQIRPVLVRCGISADARRCC